MKHVKLKPSRLAVYIIGLSLINASPAHALIPANFESAEIMVPTSSTTYTTTSTDEYLPTPSLPLVTPEKPAPALEQGAEIVRSLDTAKQSRIINLAANISNRLDTALVRLQNIQGRMTTRAELLKAAGNDTSSADAILFENAALLNKIKERLQAIDTLVYTATTAPTPKTAWRAVSQEYITNADDLRTSKLLLTDALSKLKTTLPLTATTSTATTSPEVIIP